MQSQRTIMTTLSNKNMQNDIENRDSAVGSTESDASIDEQVIESSRAIVHDAQTVSRQPTIQAVPTPSIQQPAIQPSSRPLPNAYSNTPTSLHVNEPTPAKSKSAASNRRLVKMTAVIAGVLIAIFGGYLLSKSAFSEFSTKTLRNSGYSYSFTFYRSAKKVTLSDGSSGYKYQNSVSAEGQPVTGTIPTTCSGFGGQWKQVFTVQLSGKQYPVCTEDNDNYALYFSADNRGQLFILTYTSAQSSAVYPALKTVFGSIHVS